MTPEEYSSNLFCPSSSYPFLLLSLYISFSLFHSLLSNVLISYFIFLHHLSHRSPNLFSPNPSTILHHSFLFFPPSFLLPSHLPSPPLPSLQSLSNFLSSSPFLVPSVPVPVPTLESPLGCALLALIGGIYLDRARYESSSLMGIGIVLKHSGTVLYYTILYYTILYYTILYYTILYYTILYYTILYCNILYYDIIYCIVLVHVSTFRAII